LITNCTAHGRTEVYRDKYVIAEIESPTITFWNVHQADEITHLKVFGKTYKRVRGSKPFYIDVPKLASIAFVTEDRQEHDTLHVVNVQSKKETVLALGEFSFGDHIGYEQFGRKRGEPFTEFADVSDDKLLLTKCGRRGKATATVNLASKSIERIESEMYDADGHIKQRFVHGKSGLLKEVFDANGRLRERMRWIDGKPGATNEVFDAQGRVIERWVDGNRIQ